jgi:uncharacterized protein (DUF305 family)
MSGWLRAWSPDTDMNGMPMTSASQRSSAMMSSSAGMGGMGGNVETSESTDTCAGMPGMMTEEQTAQLTAAAGADFDRLFLQLIITHHQGAIEMADAELAQGSNPAAQALAASIKTSQTQEITTMQQMLGSL